MTELPIVRLERAPTGRLRKTRAPAFDVFLDGDLLLTTPRPLTDGSRALLARGYDPARLMTVRVRGKTYDSFKPITIGAAAKWTVTEGDKAGLSRRPWMPYSRSSSRPSGDNCPSQVSVDPVMNIANLVKREEPRISSGSSGSSAVSSSAASAGSSGGSSGCPGCGKMFRKRRSGQVFCSSNCRLVAHRRAA